MISLSEKVIVVEQNKKGIQEKNVLLFSGFAD